MPACKSALLVQFRHKLTIQQNDLQSATTALPTLSCQFSPFSGQAAKHVSLYYITVIKTLLLRLIFNDVRLYIDK